MLHFPQVIAASMDPLTIGLWIGGVIVGVVLLIVLYFIGRYLKLWLQAYFSDAGVRFVDLIGMQLRRVDPRIIVLSRIQSVKAGLNVSTDDLETHFLAGGRVRAVVNAMVAANHADLELPWDRACAIDLAGRDILDAVATSVNPKVIECPHPALSGSDKLDAVAKDGIRLLCKCRVTVRTNLAKLIGGATEETVIARVGQAIVSGIGSAETYKNVLENPDEIAKKALESGLDAGTAYTIMSVDIADISVAGVETEANVGAKLEAEQAEANKLRFQAEAEQRRAQAVAQEQEFSAEIEQNRAKVVLAEAEIPQAIAEAFRSGNLGIMDYYKLRNIQADTTMRKSIAEDDPKPTDP
jgi:uncharacterized protein YqfA (UPF0365 family)